MRLTKDEPAENQTVIVISNQNFPVNAMTGETQEDRSCPCRRRQAKGRVAHWNSVDEMFDNILGEWS